MAMNGRPDLSDDALHELLETRSRRAGTEGLLASVRTEAATTRQRRGGTLGFQPFQGPRAIATGIVGLVVILVAIGLTSRSFDRGTSTASGSPPAALTPASSGPDASVVLSVAQLNTLRSANPAAVTGHLLVIDGTIASVGSICTTGLGGTCTGPGAQLVGSNPDVTVVPSATAGPGPWNGTGPSLSGPFAAVLVEGGTLQYQGRVEISPHGSAFLPSQLPDPSNAGSGVEDGYWLVHGWIAGLGITPSCPSVPAPASTAGPQYTCGGLPALLSDDSRQPVQVTSGGFSVDGGTGSVVVQSGAYEGFAPSPLTIGIQTRPEDATFLVQQTYVSTCPEGSYCGIDLGGYHWAISSRIDPLPADVTPPNQWEAGQPVLPLTADQLNSILLLNSNALLGRELVITGTIDIDHTVNLGNPSGSSPAPRRSPAVLTGSIPILEVETSAGVPLPSRLPYVGTFAARMVDTRTLEYEGPVATAFAGGAILPSQLLAAETGSRVKGSRLVEGWITGRLDPLPCPKAAASPSPGPQWGCGETAILSDTDIQPETSDSFTIPPASVQVQNGAYQDFAPGPASPVDPSSSALHLSEPELATFLVTAVYQTPCAPDEFCAFLPANGHWQIVARIDPWPVPALP